MIFNGRKDHDYELKQHPKKKDTTQKRKKKSMPIIAGQSASLTQAERAMHAELTISSHILGVSIKYDVASTIPAEY